MSDAFDFVSIDIMQFISTYDSVRFQWDQNKVHWGVESIQQYANI
jgi:hypothetical protein